MCKRTFAPSHEAPYGVCLRIVLLSIVFLVTRINNAHDDNLVLLERDTCLARSY